MIYVTSFISIILILCCFIRKNSKTLFYITFFWMWILFTFSYDKADDLMYQNLYAGNLVNKVEIGFTFLCDFFYSKLNIPFRFFLGIYGALGLTLVGSTIYKYSNNKSFATACYFIFPFIFDAIQIRNFMAMSILIFALRFLIRNNRFDWLKYLMLNVIAISIHSFSIIGLFFLTFNWISKKKLFIITIIATIIEYIALKNRTIFINLLSVVITKQKLEAYFTSNAYAPGMSSIIKSIMIIIIMLISIKIIYDFVRKQNKINEEEKFVDITFKMYIIFILFIPLLFYTNIVMRLPRSMLVLLYILISNVINNKIMSSGKIKKVDCALIISLIMLGFIWIQGFIISINNFGITYKPLLENNYFLELFIFK